MKISIDESGSFAVPRNGSDGFCCVGGLVIADAEWENLDARFAQFKAVVAPDGAEIKGSRLSDAEMKHALALFNEADAKLFIGATAGVLFSDASLNVFKEQQAHYLGANLTDQHKPKVRQQMADLQQRMRAMAPQEFLQLYVLTRLIERILRVTPNHFGFFAPDELGAFHWTVDSKNEGRSALENCWTMMGGGLLQSAFLSEPSMWIPSIDTSAFDKAFLEEDQSWPDYIPPEKRSQRSGQIMNLGKILCESFSFADSRTDASLQLADIATNAFRRVVRGNLPREFIPFVSKMLIGFEGPTIELHSMHDDTVNYPKLAGDQEAILMALEAGSWRIGKKPWIEHYFRRQMKGKASR